ncbi:hypothetical protein R3I94_003861 [Phoxinus phoxinus]
MATTTGFSASINVRNKQELYLEGKHIILQDLKLRDDLKQEKMFTYLSKNIPDYPTPVEFHITELAHVTKKTNLQKIWDSEGFKGLDEDSLLWWSLKINEADIRAAERWYLKSSIQDISEEEIAAQQPFLSKFTTSPAFINETSCYGNFAFTFPLTELMEAYKKQMCEDEEPVLRVYGTKLFKKLIEYVVLVHSPRFNETFSKHPLLASSPLVVYEGNQIIWRAQAICELHNCQLEIHGKTADTQTMDPVEFYVWDHVTLAFHVNKDEVLTFPKTRLKPSLSCCKIESKELANGGISDLNEATAFLESLSETNE